MKYFISKEPIEIIVGDDKQPDFKPQVKFQKWNNECNVSIRLKTDVEQKPTKRNGKISTANTRFYEVENGYEFEVILDKKPESNVIEFTLQDKGVKYHYQSRLTKKQIELGYSMPENVEGSYAAYTNKTGGKYQVGKVGHIYRPEIIDKKGNKVWGTLKIKKGILSVTIPQEFLDKATYPVTVDPTFGYTSAGASSALISHPSVEIRLGNYFTSPANGTLDSLSASLSLDSGTDFKAKGFVNEKDSNGSGSHDQIATAEITSQTGEQSWRTFTLDEEEIEKDTDYILNVQGIKGETTKCYYDTIDYTGSNSTFYSETYFNSTYSSPEDPWEVTKSEGISGVPEWEIGMEFDPDFLQADYDSCVKAGDYPKKYYLAKVYHIASADNEPGVGVDWEDYWIDMGNVPTLLLSIYATYTETDKTASYTALPIDITIPSVTADSKEEREASISSASVEAIIPDITASSVEVRTADFTATSLIVNVPEMAANSVEVREATIEPISINVSIPEFSALPEEEALAAYESLSISAVIPEITAIGTIEAKITPLGINITIPEITATSIGEFTPEITPVSVKVAPVGDGSYEQENTATIDPLSVVITPISPTAEGGEERTATLDPLSVLGVVGGQTATYEAETTASYATIIISVVPPEMTSTYLAELTSAYDPLSVNITPIDTTPSTVRKRTYISFGTKLEYYVEDILVEDVG